MTNIEILVNGEGILLGYNIKGHSGVAQQGEDIVCAAVSSAAYFAANTITDVINAQAQVFVGEGEMFVHIKREDAGKCQDILQGLKAHLLALEEQYQGNITVNYTEVE